MKLKMLFSASLLLFACSKTESKPPFVHVDSAQPGVAAKYDGNIIQEAELTKGIESDLYEEELKIYQMKMDSLKNIIADKIMQNDPKSKGMNKNQYMEKYVFQSVTEKDIDEFIKERNLPKDQITKDIRERIRTVIQGEKNNSSIDAWIAKELKGNKIEVFFKKPSRPKFNVEIGNSALLGSATAKVKIVEFSDFQCPHCSRAKAILDEVKKKYKDDVAIVFKHYPLPFHTQARVASNAALCAKSLDEKSFWKMYDFMFANQTKLSVTDLKDQAKKIGLDSVKFAECLDANEFDKDIQADIDQGNSIGVKSTPTIFVNGQLVMGAQGVEVFSEIIDEELAKK
jgi:protein-disulfide isomerase